MPPAPLSRQSLTISVNHFKPKNSDGLAKSGVERIQRGKDSINIRVAQRDVRFGYWRQAVLLRLNVDVETGLHPPGMCGQRFFWVSMKAEEFISLVLRWHCKQLEVAFAQMILEISLIGQPHFIVLSEQLGACCPEKPTGWPFVSIEPVRRGNNLPTGPVFLESHLKSSKLTDDFPKQFTYLTLTSCKLLNL